MDMFSKRGIAKLAWRATKFLTRAGFNLARRGAENGIRRVRNRQTQDVKNEMIEGEYEVPQNRAANDWRLWNGTRETTARDKTERLHWGTKK